MVKKIVWLLLLVAYLVFCGLLTLAMIYGLVIAFGVQTIVITALCYVALSLIVYHELGRLAHAPVDETA